MWGHYSQNAHAENSKKRPTVVGRFVVQTGLGGAAALAARA
ncbi:hypothetical protein ARMA_0689 [Ardenticatena maritima]|uniref:Uncharacterized protein n=1 Tax=Ardenticatena maritima TaxID=872965 RepID=A0A0M8K875_9CHLR|nr:hypothetical protein ARMA_0689 [Ardenticatena maritima]